MKLSWKELLLFLGIFITGFLVIETIRVFLPGWLRFVNAAAAIFVCLLAWYSLQRPKRVFEKARAVLVPIVSRVWPLWRFSMASSKRIWMMWWWC